MPLNSPEELLTLASIVEKETGVAEERPRVASVFVNRLERGMRLQTDPSVIYGITKGEGPLGRGLKASELATATPYNTYVQPGLPPTPIANPGQAAIEAAAHPEPGGLLYFVADGIGRPCLLAARSAAQRQRRGLAAGSRRSGRPRRRRGRRGRAAAAAEAEAGSGRRGCRGRRPAPDLEGPPRRAKLQPPS